MPATRDEVYRATTELLDLLDALDLDTIWAEEYDPEKVEPFLDRLYEYRGK